MESNSDNSKGRGVDAKMKVSTKRKLMQLRHNFIQERVEKFKKSSTNVEDDLPVAAERESVVLQNNSEVEALGEEANVNVAVIQENYDSEPEDVNGHEEASEFVDGNISDNWEKCISGSDYDDDDNRFEDSNDSDGEHSSFVEFSDMLMFPQSGLQVNHVMEMLMGYFIQFGVTEEARIKLINIIKVLAGPLFTNLTISNYKLNKVMDAPSDTIIFHYYCKQCEKEIVHSSVKSDIKGQSKVCQQCQSTNKIHLSNNKYFLTVNFEYQLQLLLKDEEIRNYLINTAYGTTGDKKTSDITDIHDSKLYKHTKIECPKTITYNLSTDGAPVSKGKSGTRSFWPLSVILNDLPPKVRYKHIFLVGIMMVRSEPQPYLMDLLIDKFKEEAVHLHTKGLSLKLSESCTKRLTFTPICVIADSVARAVLQNRMKYNGYSSCSYCYQVGYYRGIVKFPFVGSDCELRTHASHMQDVQNAEFNNKSVRGVKGRSSFCNFPNIDMVRSFSLDGMHNSILGVTDQIWNLLKTKISASDRRSLDELLLCIQPPRQLHRMPEKLSKIGCWKATNFKSWLLHFSVPLLCTLKSLPTNLLQHYVLFVNAIYVLSKTKITESDLLKCKKDLLQFVAEIEINYGISAMTFNVHLLMHAVDNVCDTGPIWATSAFPYESNIFILKEAATGPKGADQQMAKKSLQRLLYKCRPRDHLPHIVKEVCEAFINEKRYTPSAKCVGSVTLFGPCQSDNITKDCESYERCSYNGMILTTAHYGVNPIMIR